MKKTTRFLSICTVLLLGFVLSACDGYYGPMMGGHMFGYGMYGMGGPFMGIIGIVVLVLLGYGIYYLIKEKGDIIGSHEAPIDILKKRYARGEITKEQYEQMKEDLK